MPKHTHLSWSAKVAAFRWPHPESDLPKRDSVSDINEHKIIAAILAAGVSQGLGTNAVVSNYIQVLRELSTHWKEEEDASIVRLK